MNEIENFERILAYGDFEAGGGAECDTKDLDKDVDHMSLGNAITARFFPSRVMFLHRTIIERVLKR